MTRTRHRGAPAPTCPAAHHDPHPNAPAHCPPWCAGQHPARLWLSCCDIVIHSRPLETTTDQALQLRLEAAEDTTGTQPAAVTLDLVDLPTLTPDHLDDYAATLRRAAIRARALLGDPRR